MRRWKGSLLRYIIRAMWASTMAAVSLAECCTLKAALRSEEEVSRQRCSKAPECGVLGAKRNS